MLTDTNGNEEPVGHRVCVWRGHNYPNKDDTFTTAVNFYSDTMARKRFSH